MNKIIAFLFLCSFMQTQCYLVKSNTRLISLRYWAAAAYYGYCSDGYSSKETIEKAQIRMHCYQILCSLKQSKQTFASIRNFLAGVKKEYADEILTEMIKEQLID